MLNNFEFSKKLRIKDSVSYRQVIQENKRFFTKHLIVYYRAHQVEYSRMGVIVSKKVSKRAVVRNRVKRTTREWFRLNQHQNQGLEFSCDCQKERSKGSKCRITNMFKRSNKKISCGISKIIIGVIKLYQFLISPLLPRTCRFEPSCSQYAKEALAEFGVLTGLFFTCRRVLRCHPFCKGGYDPLPQNNRK